MSVFGLPTLASAGPDATVPEPAAVDAPEASSAGSSGADDSDANTRAAVLPMTVEGEPLPEADQAELTRRLVEGLARGDFAVTTPEQVLASSPGAATCKEAGCLMSIAGGASASHVVRTVIESRDRDYDVRVVLYDGETGAEVATSQDSCQICGVVEVGDLIDAAASTLRTKLDALAQGPATLIVSSEPVDAQVSIDGELKGTTPFNAPVIPGKHVLRISKDGFITVEREVTFVEGIEDTQSFQLEKVPSRLPARPWGWVSLGVGAAGLGASVAFVVLGQTEVGYTLGGQCDVRDAEGDCPRVWNTEAIVFGTAVAGAALATLGVAILLNSSRRKSAAPTSATTARRRTRRPRVGVGLGSVSLQGHF